MQFQAVDLVRGASRGKPFWHAEATGGPLWMQPRSSTARWKTAQLGRTGCPRMEPLVELIARHLDLPNVTLERLERFDSQRASTIEKLLVRTTAYYNSITRTTKHFERNAGTRWILGMDEVERYVIEGVRAFESVESQSPDHHGIVVAEDRFRWNVER